MRLDEVVVNGQRIIHGTDGDIYIPSEAQRERSANGLDLLDRINLPGIEVDEVRKTVSSASPGSVLVRLNGVEATLDEAQALLPSQVLNIDYITMPGLKYGKGIAAVIDIKTRHGNSGVAVGVNTMNALTTNYNDDSGWAKYNSGSSEFGVRYKFMLNGNGDVRTHSDQLLRMSDSDLREITKVGKYNDCRYTDNDITLSYNFADTLKRVFDVKLAIDWNRFPNRILRESVTDGNTAYDATTRDKDIKSSTTLKLYYSDDYGHGNSFSAYIAAAYVGSKFGRGYVTPDVNNLYDVSGEKYSVHGELYFTNDFGKPGAINIGYQQDVAYTSNKYVSSSDQKFNMRNDSQYLFAEYAFTHKALGINVGFGESRDYFSSGGDSYTYWTLRPNLNIRYNLTKKLSLRYQYSRETSSPELAQLTDFVKRDNDYEATQGDANLKPYHVDGNKLSLTYDLNTTYLMFAANYDYGKNVICDNAPMQMGNYLLYTTGNGADMRHLQFTLYGEQYLFNKKLFVYVMPSLTRDIVDGTAYNHTNSYWSVRVGASVYIGKFSLNFDYNPPKESLNGETLTHQFSFTNFSVSYKRKTFSAAVGLWSMFNHKGTGAITEQLSDIASGKLSTRNYGFGNMVYVSCSWSISSGKKHLPAHVISTDANDDTGIIK